MAYSWAQLAFVEKWRLQAVRGAIIGMHRPADRTFFDLRLKPGQGNVGSIPSTTDIRLQDSGDIIREKRLPLLHQASVVVRVVGESVDNTLDKGPRPKHQLEVGSIIAGTVVSLEDDEGIVDIGFPVVVQFTGPASGIAVGEPVSVSVSDVPKGFLVI